MGEAAKTPRALEVVLASGSPRRRQLLEEAGVAFRVHAADADESLDPDLAANPPEAAKKLAERKAHAAVEELLADGFIGTMAVVASDTMVVLDGRIFGKPQDAEAARAMLRALSGRTHQVMTAVSVWMVHCGEGEDDVGLAYRTFLDTTAVTFRLLDDAAIDAYIATGDPFDKAGAYGIQSGGGAFVEAVDGSLDTVIGLPVGRLLAEFPFLRDGAF